MSRDDAPDFGTARCCSYCIHGDNSNGHAVWCELYLFHCYSTDYCGGFTAEYLPMEITDDNGIK